MFDFEIMLIFYLNLGCYVLLEQYQLLHEIYVLYVLINTF